MLRHFDFLDFSSIQLAGDGTLKASVGLLEDRPVRERDVALRRRCRVQFGRD